MSVARVLQNEYTTWVVQDKHANAYKVLETSVSTRMASILGLGSPTSARKCLACHALAPAETQKAGPLDLGDGVTCENCHGPASEWLGPHALRNSNHAHSVSLGMYDTKNLMVRAELCLSCHLGNGEKEVDHEMIAAGHPDLTFELDSYDAIEPPHWKEAGDGLYGVRVWSVGQAVQLRETLHRLARHASGTVWPEYSEYECFACHHPLGKTENSWRQQRGYANRRPGNAPWNDSSYTVLRILAKEVDANASQELEKNLTEVFLHASELDPDRKALAATATEAASTAQTLAGRLNAVTLDRAQTLRLLKAISADGDQISKEGTRSADQAAMAIDSLFITYAKNAGAQPAVRESIDGLFQRLKDPSGYSAPQFAAQMRKVNAALRDLQ